MLVVPIYCLPKNQSFCNSCSLLLEPIVCSTLYLPLSLDIICTDTILDYLIFYAKTCPKIQTGLPFQKAHSVKSSISEHVFTKCGKQQKILLQGSYYIGFGAKKSPRSLNLLGLKILKFVILLRKNSQLVVTRSYFVYGIYISSCTHIWNFRICLPNIHNFSCSSDHSFF